VDDSKGQFNAASYESLMAASAVQPNEPSNSSLVTLIEDGDMPKGGIKVTAKELKMLKEWVSQGAKFDGNDASAPLKSFAPGGSGRPDP
jgi:hypothetical protein